MTPADRTMPVIDAYPVPALRGDHYRALFPDGEVTYPSRESMQRAGLRVGAAIRFHSEPVSLRPGPGVVPRRAVGSNGVKPSQETGSLGLDTRSASEVSPLRSPSPAHGRRGSVAADPPFGAGAAPSGGREAGASDQTGSAAER